MRKLLPTILLAGVILARPPMASAQATEPVGTTNLNRFGLSYRLGFNISATFNNLGGFAVLDPLTNPRHSLRTPNGDLYNYDNGYVYPDQTQNAHPGYTWYYGYVTGTSLSPANAPTDFDLYHSSAAGNISSRDNDGDPQHGLEVTYNRQLGAVGRGFWGLEAGLGFTHLSIQDNRTFHGPVTRVADTFRTGGGAVLLPAPQAFPAEGPAPNDPNGWPLVGIAPVGSSADTCPTGATISGHRELDAELFSLRLGPYLDYPLGERWTISLSAGLALMEVSSDFKFNETVAIDPAITLATLPAEPHRSSGSRSELLVGGYVGGEVSYAVNDRFRLFTGAQFLDLGRYTHNQGGKQAVLDLRESIFVTLGFSYSF